MKQTFTKPSCQRVIVGKILLSEEKPMSSCGLLRAVDDDDDDGTSIAAN